MNDRNVQEERSDEAPIDRRSDLQGMLLIFLGATFWGFSATCVSYLVDRNGISVPWLADARLFVAGTLFLIAAIVRDRSRMLTLVRNKSLLLQMAAYVIVAVVMMQIGYMFSIKYTNPGTALLLLEISIPMVLVYECIKSKKAPTRVEIIAIVLAIAGVLCISTQGNVGSLGINSLGLLFGLMSAFANAGYILLSAKLVKECGALVTNAFGMLAAAILLMPLGRPWEIPPEMNGYAWLVFAGIVLVGTMAAYAAFSIGVTMTGTVNASLIGVFEPVSGAVISAIWLGTVFSMWDLLGGILIISMMVVVALKR